RMTDDWVPIFDKSLPDIIDTLRDLELDIALDLAGHTSNNGLAMMAHRVAPVQMSWLGYPNTTGLMHMDYRIVDHITDPVDADRSSYTEELVRMDRCFLCYTPPTSLPQIEDKSSRQGVVFGSFNAITKINADVLDSWIKIIAQVPGSKLVVKSLLIGEDKLVDNVRKRFIDQGVDGDRLEVLGAMHNPFDHVNLYNEIDIGLDPYPYNGTTTTCEAMSMGIPIITLCGDIHASRVGASLLTAMGLEEFIAHSPEDYINKAVRLAQDKQKLRALQASLRDRLMASSLVDGADYTQHFSQTLRDAWGRYCETGVSRGIERHGDGASLMVSAE
ncbi:MAG: hypothetical protein AAF213_10155, partial [Pseudomonadota bacterium]